MLFFLMPFLLLCGRSQRKLLYHPTENNYLDEILKDGNGYHTNKETSLKSSDPKPCIATLNNV